MIPILGMFSTAKIIIAGVLIAAAIGGWLYVKNLQSTVNILKQNQIILENAVEGQKIVIERQIIDTKDITTAIKQQHELSIKLNERVEGLRDKFEKNTAGKARDIDKIAAAKSAMVTKIINKASVNVARCFEIATGSPLTEKEGAATKKSETNAECTDLANPNYKP